MVFKDKISLNTMYPTIKYVTIPLRGIVTFYCNDFADAPLVEVYGVAHTR